jgi:hypothetical protein
MAVDENQGDDKFDTNDRVDFPPVSITGSNSKQELSEPINNYRSDPEEGGNEDYVNNQSNEDEDDSVSLDEAFTVFMKE